ncbi:MAG TPA: D-alanyl-D-alanine carboxypeptidase family protein [Verrucomicrobiaceae bacterium]
MDRRSTLALGCGAGISLFAGISPRLFAQNTDSASEISRLQSENEQLKKQLAQVTEEFRHYRSVIAGNQARGAIPAVRAQRVIVVDAKTGDILAEKNADVRGPVASTQKLLTSLIVVESGGLEEYLTVQESDTDCAPVRIGLREGETYPRIQLLTALLVKSSNDIAQALARDNAGSIEAFVDRMNVRARALGMNDSHFVNPHGLPVDDQYSTARDMARLALAADTNPVIRDLVEVRRFAFTRADGRIIQLETTNRVMRSYPFCDGMKTGYTQLAGHCLVCSGEKEGRRRLVVALSDNESIWKDAQALLEWSLRA